MGRKRSTKPTSFDIAYLAGVSQPTVSRALRGSRSVSEATRERIAAIARELNYSVDKNASSLRSQRSNTIALLFFEDPTPDGTNINPFFLAMLGSITRETANRGLDLLISFQKLEDDWHARYHDSHRADGLILLGYGDYTLYEARLNQLVESGTQFVRWGSVRDDNIGPTVGSDNAAAGRLAGAHLLAQGRRRVAFLGQADEHCPEFADRYRGLCEVLGEAGIAPDPALKHDALSSEGDGRAATKALIASGAPFDAIFAASDLIAIGALRALAEAGLSVPQDVAVIGFDDIPAASLTSPPLTTISQDLKSGGELLVETLLAGIEDRAMPSRVIPAKLMVRGSTGGVGRPGQADRGGDQRTKQITYSYAACRKASAVPAMRHGFWGEETNMSKPRQSWAGLWNISFGFFGIQIGFALQNANMSRVFQSLGSSLDDLPVLWVAAPLTGLLVQPVIGHLSDRTWLGRLGRRRPYFLAGALLAALALAAMPLSGALLMAALLLWMLDASLNISMEPFRAFVGDMLDKDQHTLGYGVQTAFIGAGAVAGSLFPWLLDHWGVSNEAAAGGIPDTVRYAFWAGGAALLGAVLWTVFSTREYSPAELASFGEAPAISEGETTARLAARTSAAPFWWIVAGLAAALATSELGLEKEVYLLAGLLAGYGLISHLAIRLARAGRPASMLTSIVGDFSGMPEIMKRLAVVQFFSWSALFIMWINTTPIVAKDFFGAADPASAAYQQGGNWVGVLFSVYNGVAAIAALALLPWLSRRIGKGRTHMACLLAGAAGYASFFVLKDPQHLIFSEVGVGIAWASILAMPYAILASSLPQAKLGIYMGLFNVFIVVPQLLVATVMGSIMKAFFPGEPIWTMAFAAGSLGIAALAMTRVQVPAE